MKKQYFQEKMQEIDDSIGVVEDLIVAKVSFRDDVGFPADFPFEIFDVNKKLGENEVCNEQMKEFFLYFWIEQDLIWYVAQCWLFVDIPHKPILSCQCVDRV